MTLDRALVIDGYMEPHELLWLAQQASTKKTIIEIGSYYGRSTVAMAENTKGTVFAVDDFKGPREDGINTNVKPNLDRENIFNEFTRNIRYVDNIIPILTDHDSYYPHILPDMVFIDGSHQYEHVKRDISRYLIFHDCLLAGHDIDFPTVKQAVDELVPGYEVVKDSSIWYKNV